MAIATLNSTQQYAAAALLALALRQAQIHQTRPLGSEPPEPNSPSQKRSSNASGCSIEEEGGESSPHLWTHESQGLFRPIFRFLDVDQKAWVGLEETATSSEAKFHVGAEIDAFNFDRPAEGADGEGWKCCGHGEFPVRHVLLAGKQMVSGTDMNSGVF